MVCPYCQHASKVTNSRPQKRANTIWRRRECTRCHAVWTTNELIQSPTTYKISVDDNLLDFHPEILLISLYEALKHRKTPELDAQYVCQTITHKIQNENRPIIPKPLLTFIAHDTLKHYDTLAADLYARLHTVPEKGEL